MEDKKSKKITISISKTIQERQFEPCSILIEEEFYCDTDVSNSITDEIFKKLNRKINKFFKVRSKSE